VAIALTIDINVIPLKCLINQAVCNMSVNMSSDAYSLLRNYMSLHRDLFAIKVNLTHAGKPCMTQQNTYTIGLFIQALMSTQ